MWTPSAEEIRKGYGRDASRESLRLTLLDTNTVIFYLKGQASVVSRLQAAPRVLAIPSVVAYEIEYGTRKLSVA